VEIVNGTKGAMELFLATNAEGQRSAVVAVKRTYVLPEHDGDRMRLARTQLPLLVADAVDDPTAPLAASIESDFAPAKSRCDVIVVGHVQPPAGTAPTTMQVAVQVGAMQKAVRVVGNRRWERRITGGVAASEPETIGRIPLTYAYAFGGMHTLDADGTAMDVYAPNPAGRGYAGPRARSHVVGLPLPNLEAPDAAVTRPDGRWVPSAFGPVPRIAASRAALAGTYDAGWRDERFPEIPADFDPRFWQSAPVDQQIDPPRGGEAVVLEQLHPERARIECRLPRLEMPMLVLKRGNRTMEPVAQVDTLVIDIDAETVTVVWRAAIPVQRSLLEIETIAAGTVCKRWWRGKVFARDGGCGCGGSDKDATQMQPATRALTVLDAGEDVA
jgi:hypothetical protein